MTEVPEDPQPEDAIEEAKRRSFLRGLNIGLLSASLPTVLIEVGWSFCVSPRYESFFRQIKVPMPGLTLLVLNNYPLVAALLMLGVVGCGIATVVWGHQKRTVLLSSTLLISSILWLPLLTIAYQLPFMSIDEGIGPKRTP